MTSQMPQWLRQSAMQADSFGNAHPLEIPIDTPELSKPAIFDTISYMKGASVLRMIEAFMGESRFMEGLHRYLVTNKFDTVMTLDLWSALGNGAKDIWGPWTENTGHPVLYVGETGDSIILEQHAFRWGGNATDAEDSVVFPIPLFLRKEDGVDMAMLFDERQSTIALGDPDFFFVNADSAGFYRVAYTPTRLRKLATQHDRLSPADRLGLVHDTMAVASTGHLGIVDGLDVIAEFMEIDEDYWVWLTMLESGVGTAASLWLYDDEISAGFEAFVRTRTGLLVKRLGWSAEYWKLEHKEDDRLTRFQSLIFEYAGLAGDEAAVEAARSMVARFPVDGESAIDPNILEPAIWIALKHGGEDEVSR
jgi:aminopeptidase N